MSSRGWLLLKVRKLNIWAAALAVLLLVGCTADYTRHIINDGLKNSFLVDSQKLLYTRQWVLPGNTRLYVAFPEGAWSIPLRRKMTMELATALNQSFVGVDYAHDPQTLSKAMSHAAANRASYVVYPQLGLYSNKLSSFIEIDEDFEDYRQLGFDRLVLLLKLYDTVTGRLVDVTQVRARSGLLSFERSTPSSLFADSFFAYADSLLVQAVK